MTKKRTYEPPLHIDMDFEEALGRFAGVDPKEMHTNIDKAKGKKPPGSKKPSGGHVVKDQTVVSLRDRRKRNHV